MKLLKPLSDIFMLVSFLKQCSRSMRFSQMTITIVVIAGIISGVSNAALIAYVNLALSGHHGLSPVSLILGFIGLSFIWPLSKLISKVLLIRLTAKSMFEFHMQLCRRILSAPLRLLEEIGPPRILAALADDVPAISGAITAIPSFCVHCAVVVSCLVYLGWLSWTLLLGVLIFLALGTLIYQIPLKKAMQHFKNAREQRDALFKHFRTLTDGAKELKLHQPRRQAFFSTLLESSATSYHRYSIAGSTTYAIASSGGDFICFSVIGLIIIVLPMLSVIDLQTLTGYTLILLYMIGPLDIILNLLPALGQATIAAKKIETLGLSLTTRSVEPDSTAQLDTERWRGRLELVNITHVYRKEGEERDFILGPLDLAFSQGELVFLVGGNGSGKTTLAKILTGLYAPESGEIRLNGQTITDETRDSYRQNFSAVFSDFFLFENLLGLGATNLDAKANDYLTQLQLNHKVQIKNESLSTIDLSHGQRKRLALFTAYLEDRPIYVFDEWAADQDPMFKEIFYFQLLPELKARGKTVLVISHDDRYYHVAERIVKLDCGKIDYDQRATYKDIPTEAKKQWTVKREEILTTPSH